MPSWLNAASLTVLRSKGFVLRELSYRGSPLYYVEAGPRHGPTMVVFPGFGDTIFSWTRFLTRYSTRFRVVGCDFPGYSGMSPAPRDGKGLTFDDQERAAELFIREAAGKADYLVGNSMGGWLGMRLALSSPERIGHLIPVNPGGVLTDEADLMRIRAVYDFNDYFGYINMMKHLWHRIPIYFYPFSLTGFYQFTKTEVFRTLLGTIDRAHFVNSELPKMKVPVSVVWGRKDTLFKEHMGRFIAEQVPGARFYPIEQAGHMPQMERPGEFHSIIDEITGR